MEPNRKAKDSVFTGLFRDKNNVLRLYKELHPEDADLTVDDIDIQTLTSVVVNSIYNDLGFVVKDKCVVLAEAQSTWSLNILVRMMFYLAETFKRYIDTSNQSIHNSKLIHLPEPELYILYTGDKTVPDSISLRDYFFPNNPSELNFRVNVITKVDTTISGQYIGFCKVYDEQRKLYSNGIDAAKETYRICLEKGYLTDYFKIHESEVITMMNELFDEEYARKQYEKAERYRLLAEGEAKGRAKGMMEALKKMIESGIPEAQAKAILGLD